MDRREAVWAEEVIGAREMTLEEWQELDREIRGDADTIYVYNESKDKIFSLNELTDSEFVKVAKQFCKEAELRVWDTLPPFKAKKTNIVDDMYLKLRLGGAINV